VLHAVAPISGQIIAIEEPFQPAVSAAIIGQGCGIPLPGASLHALVNNVGKGISAVRFLTPFVWDSRRLGFDY
jgi:phosphotransferase system IIA component